MRIVDIITSAVRNAFRSKLRTTLTVLSLFVGAFTLTLTTALGAGVNAFVTTQVATLSTGNVLLVTPAASVDTSDGPKVFDPQGRQQASQANPLGSGTLLNEDDIDAMRGMSGIARVDPVRRIAVEWIGTPGAAADQRYELTVNPTSSIGRSDLLAGAQLDQAASEHQIIVPDDYLDALGFADAAAAVGQSVQIGYTDAANQARTTDATVVGVARGSLFAAGAGVNTAVTTEIADAQAVPGQPAAYSIAVATLTADGGTVTDADIAAVKGELTDAGLAGQTVQDQLGVVQTVINGIIGVLSAFAVVALIAASFGIVNTLLMSVQERSREIGLMKAMGMSNGRVFSLFSLEAVVIGFLGSAIGALAAIGIGTAIAGAAARTVLSQLPGLTILLFQPATVITVILVIMLIALLSGVLPARRAARQDPIESLRYE